MNVITTKTPLFKHQEEAVMKLLPIRVGALFMDMGTGKSLTAIYLAMIRANKGKIKRVVWFSPVALKITIAEQISIHTGMDKDICIFDGKTSQTTLNYSKFWYCVGIESISSSDRVVFAVNDLIDEHTLVIVDESSYIKGHRSKRTERITRLSERARYRLILTGTPFTQGVVDLYAQMFFLSPKILGYRSFYSFARNHLEYSDKYPGLIVHSHNTEWLANKIKPYVYQVTKEQCLDLPNKLHVDRYFSLTDEQEEASTTIKERIFEEILDYERENDRPSSILIFKLFSSLQQISCGYWNDTDTGEFYEYDHQRLTLLNQVIAEIAHDEKIIIWAKYHYDIKGIVALLSEQCGATNIAQFHGKLNEKERAIQLSRFREGAKFFVATQSTGGHGLTLNESCYSIFYNCSFKYSEHIQAEDRNHRIGQSKQVTYINLWSSAGIESRIANALATKGSVLKEFREEVEKIKEQKKYKKKHLRALINSM